MQLLDRLLTACVTRGRSAVAEADARSPDTAMTATLEEQSAAREDFNDATVMDGMEHLPLLPIQDVQVWRQRTADDVEYCETSSSGPALVSVYSLGLISTQFWDCGQTPRKLLCRCTLRFTHHLLVNSFLHAALASASLWQRARKLLLWSQVYYLPLQVRLKSAASHPSHVRYIMFNNRTSRSVQTLWLNYQGNEVTYSHLPPNTTYWYTPNKLLVFICDFASSSYPG